MILANGTPVVAAPSIPGYQRDTGAGTVLLSEMVIRVDPHDAEYVIHLNALERPP